LYTSNKIDFDFFMTAEPLKEIWNSLIVKNPGPDLKFVHKVGLDVVDQSFQKFFGTNDISKEFRMISSNLPTYT